jgi:hypothetical protein
MSVTLPPSLLVLERGWLSANNILCFDGNSATLVDSGYVTHAEQTVDIVDHALRGRRLEKLINTHSHSDHIGGNAALQKAFDCEIIVPAGLHATIADWDEDALLLSPLGQQGARFQHDSLLGANNEIEMGGLNWQTLAVPGHDMEALGLLQPGKAHPDLRRRPLGKRFRRHLPGTARRSRRLEQHACDAGNAGQATDRHRHSRPRQPVCCGRRWLLSVLSVASTASQTDIDKLAWHAIKVIVSFAMMEKRRLPIADFPAFILNLPFAVDVNTRYLNLPDSK